MESMTMRSASLNAPPSPCASSLANAINLDGLIMAITLDFDISMPYPSR